MLSLLPEVRCASRNFSAFTLIILVGSVSISVEILGSDASVAVTPAQAGVHGTPGGLDSRFRGNDGGKLTLLPFPTDLYTLSSGRPVVVAALSCYNGRLGSPFNEGLLYCAMCLVGE